MELNLLLALTHWEQGRRFSHLFFSACEINALHSAVRSTLKSRQAILDLNLVIDEIPISHT